MSISESVADALLEGYRNDPRAQHVGKRFLPSRDEALTIVQLLLQLTFPGYHGRQDLTEQNVAPHVRAVVATLASKLEEQIELCLCYLDETRAGDGQTDVPRCRDRARTLARTFLERVPSLRAGIVEDVQAAYDGDPAARDLDEIILAYPGLLAVAVYRYAHELYELGVPVMPRIMTEWAHTQTGADIHPGAKIGPRFFLDHATGIVIGETTEIGADVKLYQGVTLGALSIPKDARGRVIRGTKRHPTVADGVTVYANATVLGGSTVLGSGSVVGGSVFLTHSVPDGAQVAMKTPELHVKNGGA